MHKPVVASVAGINKSDIEELSVFPAQDAQAHLVKEEELYTPHCFTVLEARSGMYSPVCWKAFVSVM